MKGLAFDLGSHLALPACSIVDALYFGIFSGSMLILILILMLMLQDMRVLEEG